ncbi:MAG: hypothetical protein WDN01_01030 [Rhizomicrobium sp.]
MNKIPVGETIRFAYAFTFGEIGTVIGLVWIPLVINAVGAFLVERGLGDAEPAAGAALPPGFGYFALYSVLAVFLVAMVAVAITRQALGLRQGPAIAHVSFGTAELHVFGGIAGLYLLFFIFAMGLTLAVVVVGGLAATLLPSKAVGEAVAAAAGSLAALAGLGAIFYALVRLSFLFVPSCVGGGGFGLSRSWELTRGNFWRIVAVGAATALPAMLVVFVVNLLILGPDYISSIAAMFRDQGHLAKYAAEQSRMTSAKMPLLLGVSLVLSPITYGLLFAPAAFAYRALAGKNVLPG